MARLGRRSGSIASVLAIVGATLLAVVPPAVAASCSITNVRTGDTHHVLQAAVDASAEDDTLLVQGICVGTTVITGTSLRLTGVATPEQPVPTLDGGGMGRVLTIRKSCTVVIRDITVTNGKALRGGGIAFMRTWRRSRHPMRLALRGRTNVVGNTAGYGGGIFDHGTLTLNGSASINFNAARHEGGGIMSIGWSVILNGSASVTGNTAGNVGGGLYAPEYAFTPVLVCSDQVVLSPNDPDDPPTTLPCR